MRISIWTKHGRLPLGYLRQYCDPVIQVHDHCLLFVIYVAKVPVVDAKATRTKKLWKTTRGTTFRVGQNWGWRYTFLRKENSWKYGRNKSAYKKWFCIIYHFLCILGPYILAFRTWSTTHYYSFKSNSKAWLSKCPAKNEVFNEALEKKINGNQCACKFLFPFQP